MKHRLKAAFLLLCGILLLSCLGVAGCGQKGPLYLPQQDSPNQEEPAEEGASDN